MRRPPIRIRTFLLGVVLVLLLVLPALTGGAAWLVERHRQETAIHDRLRSAVSYLTAHRAQVRSEGTVPGFAPLLDRLDLGALLILVIESPPSKSQLYVSPALNPVVQKQRDRKTGPGASPPTSARWTRTSQRIVSVGTRKSPARVIANLYYRPASRATRAVVALVSGLLVLLAGLGVSVWLAGRWMVTPLTRLSAEVDKVAGGDLELAVPRSPIGEIANIAQAVDGMTSALGETAERRARADEARRFLVTSVAHDLRTPLFALRGHLQAIGSGIGDPGVHLQHAEARADALERLIGNLFAYTRDDYVQPAVHLEVVPVAELLQEVAGGLEHAARLRDNAFDLRGDRSLDVSVDRDRVKRALANVLDNALRHSPPHASIELGWAAVDGSAVEIVVRDHGPGIDPDLLPQVFDPGVRGATTGDADGGAGLGLTIAKRLLEHQEATLTAGNAVGGGAEIRITLSRGAS